MNKHTLITKEKIAFDTYGGKEVVINTLEPPQSEEEESAVLLELGEEYAFLNHGDIDNLIKALTTAKLLNEIRDS
ncbi:hypothetical protein [Exiguobacterium sp. s163]|uniref:hypothetical protein n=1 Tax=Exiguobacterium sp. s163 TaxID=2751287 RepID=UPI001BE5B1D0|nr:hypothetical protein [Exiguobacterium sp. s163]